MHICQTLKFAENTGFTEKVGNKREDSYTQAQLRELKRAAKHDSYLLKKEKVMKKKATVPTAVVTPSKSPRRFIRKRNVVKKKIEDKYSSFTAGDAFSDYSGDSVSSDEEKSLPIEHMPVDMFGVLSSDDEFDSFMTTPPSPKKEKTLADREKIDHINSTKVGVIEARRKKRIAKKLEKRRLRQIQRASKEKPIRKEFEEPSMYFIDLNRKKLEEKHSDLPKKKKTRGGVRKGHPNKNRRVARKNDKQAKYEHAMARLSHSNSVKAAAKERRRLAKEKKKSTIKTESGIYYHPEDEVKVADDGTFFKESMFYKKYPDFDIKEDDISKFDFEDLRVRSEKIFSTLEEIKKSLLDHFSDEQRSTFRQILSILALVEACRGSTFTKKASAIALYLGNESLPYTKEISFGILTFSILYDKYNKDNVKTESFADSLDDFTATVKDVWDSELVTALRNVIILLGTAKLFSKEVGLGIIAALGAVPSMKLDDLFFYISKIFSAIFKFFEDLWNGVPFSKAMLSEDPITYAKLHMARLQRESFALYYDLPITGYVSHRVWQKETGDLLSLVESMLPKIRKADPNYVVLDRLYRDLSKCYELKVRVQSAKARSCPYGIIIHGDPGIGKSAIVNIVSAVYARVSGTEYSAANTYHRIASSEYWEGYENQEIIHYSEVGNSTEAVLSSGDPCVTELCTLIDRLPFPLNMADVTLKGKVFANPGLVVMDTNSPDMNLKFLIKNPAAVERRFVFIKPIVRSCYTKDGSTALDPVKSLRAQGVLLDRYTFAVTIKTPMGLKNTEDETIVLDSIYDLIAFLETDIARHKVIENSLSDPEALCKDVFDEYDRITQSDIDETKVETGLVLGAKFGAYLTTGLYKEDMEAIAFNLYQLFCSLVVLALLNFVNKLAHQRNFFDRAIGTIMVLCSFFISSNLFVFLLISVLLVWVVLPNVIHRCQKLLSDYIDELKSSMLMNYRSIKYYSGFKTNFLPIYSGKFYLSSTTALISTFTIIGSGGALALMYRYFKTANKTESSFQIPSDFNVKLEHIEKSMHCGKSYERIPNSLDVKLWNVKFPDPKTLHTDSAFSLYQSVASNIRTVTMPLGDGTSKVNHLLGVQGNFAVINTHFLGNDWQGKVIKIHNSDGTSSKDTFDTRLDKRNVCHLGGDISVIFCSSVRFRDILMHVNTITDTFPKAFSAVVCGEDTVAVHVDGITADDRFMGKISLANAYKYAYASHKTGMCGVPLIAEYSKGASIMGIHFAGNEKTPDCYAAVLSKRDIELGISMLVSSSPYLPALSSVPVSTESLLDPVRKSAFRHEVLPGLEYYGKLPGNILMNKKSAIVKTAFHDKVPDFMFKHLDYKPEVMYGPPQMKPKIVDGVYVSPYNKCLKAMSHHRPALKLDVMKKTVEVITEHLIEELTSKGVTELRPIDIDSAINGATHDCFLRRVNPNTSGGFGFPGKKDVYIPVYDVNTSDETIYREPIEDLKEKVFNILDGYCAGIGHNIFYKGHLKEEARPVGKKTRMFYIAPLDDLIVSRMVLFPIFSLMIEHCKVFCTAIGTNTHVDADDMAHDVLDFGDKSFVGDYKYWDIHNLCDVGAAANKIIYNVSKHFGMNELSLKVLQGYLGDELYPVIEMLLDVFMVPGMVTSGKYGTAEMNSLRNLVNAVYIFYDTAGLEDMDFFEKCLPITYGDDIMVTVKDDVCEKYNGTTFQAALRDNFNMTFTAPDKSPVVKKWVSFYELDFLKRNFAFRKDLDRYVLQLSKESLYKTLSWTLPSRSISTIEQLLFSSGSVLREMFFYLEKEAYSEARLDMIEMIIESFPLADRVFVSSQYPHFDEIRHQLFGCELSEETLMDEKEEPQLQTETGMRVYAYSTSALIGCATSPKRLLSERIIYVENSQLAEEKAGVLDITSIKEKYQYAKNIGSLETSYKESLRDIAILKASLNITGDLTSHKDRKQWYTDSRTRMEFRKKLSVLSLEADILSSLSVIARFNRKNLSHDEVKTESGLDGEMSDGIIAASTMETTQNFTDVGGTETKDVELGSSSLSEVYASSPPLGMFPNRPVELYNVQLAVGSSVSAQIDAIDLISSNPTVRSKFRNFGYAKFDTMIRFCISGTPFHYGTLLVAYVPYADRVEALQALIARFAFDATSRPALLAYLSQMRGCQLININENKPTEIRIPFISHKPVYRLFNDSTSVLAAGTSFEDFVEAGSLFIYSLTAPKSVSTTPSNVSIQVLGWFENLELFAPTATQMEITTESGIIRTESGDDERDVGPVEHFSTSAALYSGWFKKIPYIGKFALASEMAFGALAGVSSIFGWSRPTIIEDPLVVKNNGYSNGAICIGGETSYRIVVDPKQELCIDPSLFGVEEDEMVINYLTKINSYIDTFAWNDNDVVMSNPIYTCCVIPNLGVASTGATDTVFQPSTLAFTALPFVFWRGDITFEFQIVCSKYHRGKLMFYYEPNVKQEVLIDADLSANKQCLAVIDIQETQNVKFCISWASCRDWLQTLAPTISNQASFRATPAPWEKYANGYIGVVPFTTLQSPDNSDIDINVFISSDNMKYNMLEGKDLPKNRNIRTESGIETSVDASCIELNGKSQDAPYIASQYFGEIVTTFRLPGRRYVETDEIAIASTAGAGFISAELPMYPRVKYPYGSISTYTKETGLFEYLRFAYLGMRGGIKKRAFFDLTGADRHTDAIKVGLQAAATTVIPSTSFSTTRNVISKLRGTVSFMPSSNAGVEFEIPNYMTTLFMFSCANDLVGTSYGGLNYLTLRLYSYLAEIRTSSATAAGTYYEESALGEDFSFYRFLSSPPRVIT